MADYGIETLLGKTLLKVDVNMYGDEDSITFVCEDGSEYRMWHEQDCCETVTIEEYDGDFDDLIGSPIIVADERSNQEDAEYGDSQTWTFYSLATKDGWVHIRWHGYSNGYYSESVTVCQTKKPDGRIGRNIKFGGLKFDAW